MMDFNFECIGEKLTDDEEKIGKLKAWGWKMSFTWRKTKLHVLTLSPPPPPPDMEIFWKVLLF